MVDREELKRRAAKQIDKANEEELERLEGDKSRLRKWLESALDVAKDVIKSAIGGIISAIVWW